MNHANPQSTTRRDAIKLGLLAGAGMVVGRGAPLFGEVPTLTQEFMTRPIPGTGERLPVVGVGTNQWGAQSEAEMAPLREIVRLMNESGARFIDTARIYGRGRAEEVIGQILGELDARDDVFIATKIPTPDNARTGCGLARGVHDSPRESKAWRPCASTFLDGVEIVLPILREWKEAERIRYLGVTTMSADALSRA